MGNTTGCLDCFETPDYIVSVKTGDTKGAGLHNSAHIILINDEGEKSRKVQLSGCCVTVFKKGKTDNFNVHGLTGFGCVRKIIIEQHREQHEVEWYIDRIIVTQIYDDTRSETVFPVHRWLRIDKPLEIVKFDSTLPQHDENIKQRQKELHVKRTAYGYRRVDENLPAKMKQIPHDEVFSNFYKWDVKQKRSSVYSIYKIPNHGDAEGWRSFEEIESLFKEKGKFRRPLVLDEDWKSDIHFGRQRLKGCNSRSLQLICKDIPKNFAVTDDIVAEYLEGFSLIEAIKENKIFIVNHSILDGIVGNNETKTISPMALFYLNKNDDLMPIAIQLYQNHAQNPVFVPGDPYYTWMVAKMWFNNADSAIQRACLLITSSHWVLEMISLSVHRTLSPSHPIFRLLAPYLRHVLPINHYEMHQLIEPGGWIDQVMTIKTEGMMELIQRYWKNFDFEKNCCFQHELEEHGVFSAEVLAEYPYRDDGFLLYGIIQTYMTDFVDTYYNDNGDLLEDEEIQSWAAELVSKDSCDFNNVPGDGKFQDKADLVYILTCVIYKATVENASLALPLYDECAFVPNYPLLLRGDPPQTKESLTEEDVMSALPTKNTTMEIIAVNKIISDRDSSGLADSRAQYQYDTKSLPGRQRFEGELRAASALISIRNRNRKSQYKYLNPCKANSYLTK